MTADLLSGGDGPGAGAVQGTVLGLAGGIRNESLIRQVDIPLTLQEIEGDAAFLYARHAGTDDGWHDVVRQVGLKLEKFFAAFIASSAVAIESTPCGCAICRNSDRLGLKIIAHVGEALRSAIGEYTTASTPRRSWRLLQAQLRRPVRHYGLAERLLLFLEAVVFWPAAFFLHYRRTTPERVLARGKRREDLGPPG